MNILHLVQDEKFIYFFSSMMDSVGGGTHRYLVHKSSTDKYVNNIERVKPFRVVDDNYFHSELMQEDLESCDVLIVHFLTIQAAKMINHASERIKIVWSGWGADYYYLLSGGQAALMGPETQKLALKLSLIYAGINPIRYIRLFLRPLRRVYTRHVHLMPAIKRVQYFSAPLPSDYSLLRRNLGKIFSATYVQLNYGSLEETFSVGIEDIKGKNILVGNSASLTNNHIEIFNLLAKHELYDKKVVVPLSYGDSEYQKLVVEAGEKVLGDKFLPILNYLPLSVYNNLLSSCSFVIMNQYRQQGLGNIGTALYGGAKLFLNKKNESAVFFKENGFCIYDIDELTNKLNDPFVNLTIEQKNKNKTLLKKIWSHDLVEKNFFEFMNLLVT